MKNNKKTPNESELKEHQKLMRDLVHEEKRGFYIVADINQLPNQKESLSTGGVFIRDIAPRDVIGIVLRSLNVSVADLLTMAIAEQAKKK